MKLSIIDSRRLERAINEIPEDHCGVRKADLSVFLNLRAQGRDVKFSEGISHQHSPSHSLLNREVTMLRVEESLKELEEVLHQEILRDMQRYFQQVLVGQSTSYTAIMEERMELEQEESLVKKEQLVEQLQSEKLQLEQEVAKLTTSQEHLEKKLEKLTEELTEYHKQQQEHRKQLQQALQEKDALAQDFLASLKNALHKKLPADYLSEIKKSQLTQFLEQSVLGVEAEFENELPAGVKIPSVKYLIREFRKIHKTHSTLEFKQGKLTLDEWKHFMEPFAGSDDSAAQTFEKMYKQRKKLITAIWENHQTDLIKESESSRETVAALNHLYDKVKHLSKSDFAEFVRNALTVEVEDQLQRMKQVMLAIDSLDDS
ncbi:MAG: hypothetical protein DHS20C17_17710 [Cyclobacteriaceae bacterium]|nr:MAG: hypothetical protein DHS20C17_17710 [Cyclobacteriaceae bacterium]